MGNNDSEMTKSSFWANLFKTPTKKDDLEDVLISMAPFKKLDHKYFKMLFLIKLNWI